MRKLSTLATAAAQPAVVLASQNPAARALFAGKTLMEVGSQHDLNDVDIKLVSTANSNGREDIKNLSVTIAGVQYLVPFSRNFPMEKLSDADFLLKCEFRESFVSIKESDGVTPKTDEAGKLVLDETKAYLSFGKPTGITIVSSADMFTDVPAETAAANS